MRSSIFIAAPLLVAASARETLVPEISGSVTITSTYTYSNPATIYLTQTNSEGVVTGLPGSGRTGLVTSQPPVATIPAGLPNGETTFFYSASSTLESFVASIGRSTTVVIGGNDVGPNASVVSGSSAGVAGPTGGSNGSGSNGDNNSDSSNSSSTTSDNAAPTNVKAAAGVLALGAVAAALL